MSCSSLGAPIFDEQPTVYFSWCFLTFEFALAHRSSHFSQPNLRSKVDHAAWGTTAEVELHIRVRESSLAMVVTPMVGTLPPAGLADRRPPHSQVPKHPLPHPRARLALRRVAACEAARPPPPLNSMGHPGGLAWRAWYPQARSRASSLSLHVKRHR